jgi:molybdopterin-guanine dinucleotide biosynthesis adapter protein
VTPDRLPVLGFVGYSGSGKTTLLCNLLPLLSARGLRIAVIKHAHHGFDIDHPGKDSYVLRKAGARQTLVASASRWALMTERESPQEPRLSELMPRLYLGSLDLVLVEGFKHELIPKIEVHRPALGHPLLFPHDAGIVAVAADAVLPAASVLVLDLNSPEQVAAFIERRSAEHAHGSIHG